MEILLKKHISLKIKHLYPYDTYESTIIIYRRRVHHLLRSFYPSGYKYGYEILDNRIRESNLSSSEKRFNNFCYSKYIELKFNCEGIIEEYKKGIRRVELLKVEV